MQPAIRTGGYLLLVHDEGKTYADYLPLHTRNAGG